MHNNCHSQEYNSVLLIYIRIKKIETVVVLESAEWIALSHRDGMLASLAVV